VLAVPEGTGQDGSSLEACDQLVMCHSNLYITT
jgi:hypothetical protein